MSNMIQFESPAQHDLPDGYFFQTTAAGRYASGIKTTITLGRQEGEAPPTALYAETLTITSVKDRSKIAVQFAQMSGLPQDELEVALVEFTTGLESILSLAEFARREEEEMCASRPSQAMQLVQLAEATKHEFFHEGDVAYATICSGQHFETYRLREQKYRRHLAWLYFRETGKTPGSQALQDALGVLEGKSLFNGREICVHLRTAERQGAIYLDSGNEQWDVFWVSPEGWEVAVNPPVKFRRPRGMQALPTPVRGGDIEVLSRFINIDRETPDDWRLLLSWITMAMRPQGSGAYPILVLFGEQGSAKSTLSKVLRSLIDPNLAALRAVPREERDLFVAANNGHLLVFDNLSGLPGWLSDALCRLSTGAGFGVRQLFTDDEEVLFQAQRPILMNGIAELAHRPDLIDRGIALELPVIAEDKRIDEHKLSTELEVCLPSILGALLDIVSAGLRELPSMQLEEMPRMADFAKWGCAIAEHCGWTPADFLTAYKQNRLRANAVAFEAAGVALEIHRLMQSVKSGVWSGTATDLYETLISSARTITQQRKDWPHRPDTLATQLRRYAPNLRQMGIECKFNRANKKRTIILTRTSDFEEIKSRSNDPF